MARKLILGLCAGTLQGDYDNLIRWCVQRGPDSETWECCCSVLGSGRALDRVQVA